MLCGAALTRRRTKVANEGHVRTIALLRISRVTVILAVCGCAAPGLPLKSDVDRQALVQFNRQLLESVFLDQDTAMLASAALPNLVVIPPGGIVENRTQVLGGIRNVAMDSVRVDDVTIAEHGRTAVVVARVTRLGPLSDAIGTGRSRIMSVFVYHDRMWWLLARSITPCIERAVVAERC